MKKIFVLISILLISTNFVSANFVSELLGINGKVVYVNEDTGLDNFKLLGKKVKEKLDYEISTSSEIPLNVGNIYGFSVNSQIKFTSKSGLVRFVLTDGKTEYLVYESYPRLHGNGISVTNNICEETCALESFNPTALKIQVIDAKVNLQSYQYINHIKNIDKDVKNKGAYIFNKENKEKQDQAKIKSLKNENWNAEETPVSALSYQEKKSLTFDNNGFAANFQGFEYYKGGIFTYPEDSKTENVPGTSTDTESTPSAPGLPATWDWRNRHGENWHTSVKNQGSCGSCGAFAATGATEHLVNLYFNQHINMNLAEAQGFFCYYSDGQTCSSGVLPSTLLSRYSTDGVVNEACFPYTASTQPCNVCSTPTENVFIGGRENFYSSMGEEALKVMIAKGAVSGGLSSMNHAMAMSGWKTGTDGKTIWIFKNSWGTGWGEAGYGYLANDISDFSWTHRLLPEIKSTMGDYEIQCVDNDNDGYCNWGITENKPTTCPETCKAEKDCDDSDNKKGPFDSSYNCILLEGCSDTDGGLNFEVYGEISGSLNGADYCLDEIWLKEYTCENGTGTSVTHECPSICKDGACVTATCSDSDGGKNYEVSGSITGYMAFDENPSDICLDDKTLQETYCFENLGYTQTYTCPNACKDGKCIELVIPTITITEPLDGSYISGNFLIVSTTTTNTISVDFYINDNYIATDTESPYSHKQNIRKYTGTNILKVVATSESGIKSEDKITFYIGTQEEETDPDPEPNPDPEPITPECSDGIDNDGDKTCDWNGCWKNKVIFYPADPDCTGPDDPSESN